MKFTGDVEDLHAIIEAYKAKVESLTRERDAARACPMIKCPFEEKTERRGKLLERWLKFDEGSFTSSSHLIRETREELGK